MRRPRIAVSAVVRHWDGGERTGVNAAYMRALVATGALPINISPLIGVDLAEQALEPFDGLVLTGGEDVHPSYYHTAPGPKLGTIDRLRDQFELALFHQARRRRLPVLGICRGLQLINVAMGGTLWQDLPTERPGPIDHAPPIARGERVHPVRIAAGSRAAQALGTTHLSANSIHHQAIRDIAPDLVATAWSDDGLIEAVETPDASHWILAVQWHPEELHEHVEAPDRGLFAAVSTAAHAWREGQAERPSSRVRRSGP
jgi:putative glutamine amidotransferase